MSDSKYKHLLNTTGKAKNINLEDIVNSTGITALSIGSHAVEKAEREAAKKEPPLPRQGSSVFDWLDYRHEYKKATGKKMTYKMLAKLCNYEEGTFEQASDKWKNERGIT